MGPVNLFARRGLLLVAGVTAVLAVLGGLARLGLVTAGLPMAGLHGPLLVAGVFGTVISLERAVALGKTWALAAPVSSAAGAVALLLGLPAGPWLLVASGVIVVGVNVAIVHRQAAAFTGLMLLGSVVALTGTIGWTLGRPVFAVAPAWVAFFVLTIAAERLELSRLAPAPRWAAPLLVGLSLALGGAACVEVLSPARGQAVFGAALGLVGLWQARFDLARRTVRVVGLPRFTAVGVLGGAAWLALTGVGWVALERPPGGPRADALLHGVFAGYVVSMVFAHAPIILPAVARVTLPFHRVLYAPLFVLHAGLGLRVAGGLAGHEGLRRFGAVVTAVALPLFVAAVLLSRWSSTRRPPSRIEGLLPSR